MGQRVESGTKGGKWDGGTSLKGSKSGTVPPK